MLYCETISFNAGLGVALLSFIKGKLFCLLPFPNRPKIAPPSPSSAAHLGREGGSLLWRQYNGIMMMMGEGRRVLLSILCELKTGERCSACGTVLPCLHGGAVRPPLRLAAPFLCCSDWFQRPIISFLFALLVLVIKRELQHLVRLWPLWSQLVCSARSARIPRRCFSNCNLSQALSELPCYKLLFCQDYPNYSKPCVAQ